MSKGLKDKLIELGADKMADLLIEISSDNELAHDKVVRAVSPKTDNVKNFKSKLKSFIGSNRYVPWKYSAQFSAEISDLLQDIRQGARSPQEGVELILEFFNADEHFFSMADDSSGHIGDVFRNDACELFVGFAKQVENKNELIDKILDLVEDDGYGVRNCLLESAESYLNAVELKTLFDKMLERSKNAKGESDSWSWKLPEIAKQMKDAVLYEDLIRKRVGDKMNSKFIMDIAKVYFSAGDVVSAQRFIDSVPKGDTFASFEKENLQKQIYKATNQVDCLKEQLLMEFRAYYSEHTLRELLNVVGADKKDSLCASAIDDILTNKSWDPSHAEFLIYCGSIEKADKYVLMHANQLDGDRYYSLLPVAEKLEANDKYLSAILIYRALTDSILSRAISKYYHHGVKYLKTITKLSGKVEDWGAFAKQDQYLIGLKQDHRRKTSFWQKLNED